MRRAPSRENQKAIKLLLFTMSRINLPSQCLLKSQPKNHRHRINLLQDKEAETSRTNIPGDLKMVINSTLIKMKKIKGMKDTTDNEIVIETEIKNHKKIINKKTTNPS